MSYYFKSMYFLYGTFRSYYLSTLMMIRFDLDHVCAGETYAGRGNSTMIFPPRILWFPSLFDHAQRCPMSGFLYRFCLPITGKRKAWRSLLYTHVSPFDPFQLLCFHNWGIYSSRIIFLLFLQCFFIFHRWFVQRSFEKVYYYLYFDLGLAYFYLKPLASLRF